MAYPEQPGSSSASSSASPVVTGGAVVLVALGVFVAWKGDVLRPAFSEPDPATQLVVGLVLVAAGLALPWAARRWHAQSTSWMAREDWIEGRIPPAGRHSHIYQGATGLAFLAAGWGVVSILPGEPENWIDWLTLLFMPAVGVGMLAFAVVGALRYRKFGRSFFVLDTNPGVIGRTLEGRVETALAEPPPAGVVVTLSCARETTSGRQSRHFTMWRDELTVRPYALLRTSGNLHVPVAFTIPADCLPSDGSRPYERTVWQLAVSASLPGIDFLETFEVPVFDTGAEPLSAAALEAIMTRRLADPSPTGSNQEDADGAGFDFPPRPGIGTVLLAVPSIILTGVGLTFIRDLEAVLALVVVGGAAAFLLVRELFYGVSLEFDGGDVVIRHRVLGLGPTRRLHAGEIREIRTVGGKGSDARRWEVRIQTVEGQTLRVAANLPNRLEAERVARRLRIAIDRVMGPPVGMDG